MNLNLTNRFTGDLTVPMIPGLEHNAFVNTLRTYIMTKVKDIRILANSIRLIQNDAMIYLEQLASRLNQIPLRVEDYILRNNLDRKDFLDNAVVAIDDVIGEDTYIYTNSIRLSYGETLITDEDIKEIILQDVPLARGKPGVRIKGTMRLAENSGSNDRIFSCVADPSVVFEADRAIIHIESNYGRRVELIIREAINKILQDLEDNQTRILTSTANQGGIKVSVSMLPEALSYLIKNTILEQQRVICAFVFLKTPELILQVNERDQDWRVIFNTANEHLIQKIRSINSI